MNAILNSAVFLLYACVTLCRVWTTSCGELQLAITLQMSCRARAHLTACRREVSYCWQFLASSGENFKPFKILVEVLVSYTYQRHVEWMSSLLVALKVVRHITSLVTSYGDMSTIITRHLFNKQRVYRTSLRLFTSSV